MFVIFPAYAPMICPGQYTFCTLFVELLNGNTLLEGPFGNVIGI